MKRRALALLLSFMMVFQSFGVFAAGENKEKVTLTLGETQEKYMEINITPKEVVKQIQSVTTDSVHQHEKTGNKGSIGWSVQKLFAVDENEGKLYIPVLKDKHTLSLHLTGGKAHHYILKGKTFEEIDKGHPPKGKLHIKLEGYFEGALVGQRKYDAASAATGSASDNKNSNVKVYGQITEENDAPKAEAWKELSKSDIEIDKGQTKIVLDEASGMKPTYNPFDSAITLSGEPKKPANYPVRVELVDIYGRRATSNEIWFSVSDIEHTYLDQVMSDVNTRLKTTANGKVLFNQEPWYIAYFNQNNKGKGQSYTVPKNINLWQGSHESGTYGQLGLILGVKDQPNRDKFEYKPDEDRIPIQDFVVPTGANLTLINMKVFSGVNIVVKDGAILNIYDSSIYGKITVEKGGRLRVNYDPEGKMLSGNKKVLSASSIQGQIILKDGAILEDSYIYSNTNNLTDANKAIQNIRPVVKVEGDAFIKGKVFIKGDESPTGTEEANKAYRGQAALAIDKGSLTILDNASLYVYGGGTKQTTSRGGNALSFYNGAKVLGEGTLVAIGGRGASAEGGFAATGDGTISVAKAYLEAGGGAKKTMAKDDAVKITKQVIGTVKDSQGTDAPAAYWGQVAAPKELEEKAFGTEAINPTGGEKIEGKPAPKLTDDKPNKGPKRVEFETNQFNIKSLTVKDGSDDSLSWIKALSEGKGSVKVNNKTLSPVTEEREGYKVENRFLYIYGLNIGDIVNITVDGYVPVQLKAIESGQDSYRLEPYQKEPEEKPYVPEKDVEITEEKVEKAKAYINGLTLDDKALAQAGVNTIKNSANIKALKEAVNQIKTLAAKGTLTDEEKKDLVRAYEGKFASLADKIRVDMHLNSAKTIANQHDKTKLHAKLESGKVVYTSALENLNKDKDPMLEVYRIDQAAYEADVQTGATPKFEDNQLDKQYFDIKKVDGKYEISVKEAELLQAHPNTALLKIVFKAKLAEGIYATGSDFVFLNKEVTPKDKDDKLIEEKDPENKPPKKKDDNKSSGHWEYRVTRKLRPLRVVKNAEIKEVPFINGYPNGTFIPEGNVTRAESATMVYKLERAKASSKKADFKDVKDTWYNEAINFTTEKNMLLAKDGYIRPDDAMTRGEFARMLAPLLPKKEGANIFTDVANHEFKTEILRAFANDVVRGYPDRRFKPDGKITRAEAVTMLNRVYKKYVTKAELEKNKEKINRFSDVKESHWAYMDIMSAINYPIINSTTKGEVSYEWTYENETTKVWVEDKKTPEQTPDEKKTFSKQSLVKENQAKVEGEIEEGATLVIVDKTKTEGGKIQITVPKTILDDIKTLKAPAGKVYDVVKSYDVSLTKAIKGSLKVSLFVGDVHNGKSALIKHLAKDGLKTYTSTVKDGYVTCTVESLSPFVVIVEEDKASPTPGVDKELAAAKEALAKAVQAAKEKLNKKDLYTAETVDALEKALKAAEALSASEDKVAIKAATEKLTEAVEKLAEKPKKDEALDAAKAKLAEAIQKAEATQGETYTKKTANVLAEALKKAKALENTSDKTAIEKATENLNAAVKALEKRGDVDALKEKIAEAKQKAEDASYTDTSKAELNKVLKAYDDFDYGNATVAIVKAEMDKVDAAVKKLIKKPVLPSEKKKVVFKPDEKPQCIAFNKDDSATKAWSEELKAGRGKVEKHPSGEAIEKATSSSTSKGYYIFSSSGSLKISALSIGDVVRVTVDGYEDVYLQVVAYKSNYKLVEIQKPNEGEDVPKVDEALKAAQAALTEAIQKAEARQGETYTKKTANVLAEALKKAKALENTSDKTAIEKATENLNAAVKALEKRGDVDALKAKIAEAKQKAEDVRYTDASKTVLKESLKAYDNFDYDNATETIVTKALADIDKVIKALVDKPKEIAVEVNINTGSGNLLMLKGIIGKTFGELKTEDNQPFILVDGSEENKVFTGWKIDGKDGLLTTEALKATVITEDMIGSDGAIFIAAEFKDAPIDTEKQAFEAAKSALQTAIEAAESLEKANYTTSAIKHLEVEIVAAKELLKTATEKAPLIEKESALREIIAGLDYRADTTLLEKKVQEAREKLADTRYTAKSKAALQAFFKNYAPDYNDYTVEKANSELEKIQALINELVEKGNSAALKAKIEEVKQLLNNSNDDLTRKSKEALKTFLNSYTPDYDNLSDVDLQKEIQKLDAFVRGLKTEDKKAELKKAIEGIKKFVNDQAYTEKSLNELKAFLKEKRYETFDYDKATLEQLEAEIQELNSAYEKLERYIVRIIVKDGSTKTTELLGILDREFGKFQDLNQRPYDFKDPIQEGKVFQGWQINGAGKPLTTEDLKKTKLLKDMVQEDSMSIVAVFNDTKPVGKKVKFDAPNNNTTTKVYVDKQDADTKTWLENIPTKAKVQKKSGEGFVDIEKSKISIYNKPSRKSLTINGLKNNDIVKIILEGYEDVYLKVENNKLVAIANPNDSESGSASGDLKPMPKIAPPATGQTNILNNVSPDANTLAWYKALNESGRIMIGGVELTKKTNENGPERGYFLVDGEGTVRIKFRHLRLNEIISIEVEGWPAVKAKVIRLERYSGPLSEEEAVFQMIN